MCIQMQLLYNIYNTFKSSGITITKEHLVESAMVQILYLISAFLNFYGHDRLTDNGHFLKTFFSKPSMIFYKTSNRIISDTPSPLTQYP